ncbi:M28 family peptidase [bacterium]|nr:M28 family peptidase [bacterium]
MKYESFKLLYDLYFERTGGSENELKAANILKDECEKFGVSAVIEDFDIDGYKIKNAKLSFSDKTLNFNYVGVGVSGSTDSNGITGEFVYIDSLEALELYDVNNKICLIYGKKASHKMYKTLVQKGCVGMILAIGNLYKDNSEVDLDPYQLRELDYTLGKIPGVAISGQDAEKLIIANPKYATITLSQDEYTKKSRNVVATIPGTKKPEEIIAFTAHYDSVPYSKGAYDNGTGSVTIMQLLAYFSEHKPDRTLKFIWCGSEEMGLLGSKAYTKAHQEELENYLLNINVDMTGVTIGFDIARVTAEEALVNYINYLGMEVGFPIKVSQGVYSSDSTPFADNGVPSLSFARLAPQGGATIHSHDDVMGHLSEANYYRTCDFITTFSERIINSVKVPVKRIIPQNMKDEIDYYYSRKERPEK